MQGSDSPKPVSGATLLAMADGSGVTSHIRSASKATGVSFDYLMAQAKTESAFEPDAKSSLSSAAGLFQFTKGTWLQLIKLHGAAHGLGELADQIEHTGRGEFIVKDPVQRQKILALRRDPALSSLIAGEYARDNKHWLEKSLGRHVGSTELYLAHFLGPAGAVKLLKARAENPGQAAADLVPQAAAKNQTMFYQQDHSAQSVAMLYDRVKQVMENPAHPPHRQTPPAELAVAALRYGDLPWSDAVTMPDQDSLMRSVRWSVQVYTDAARSAAKISAPMPSVGQDAAGPVPAPETPAAESVAPAPDELDRPINDLFRAIFG